ncbi:MAG: flagella synthesis protein FlgN [Gammaproteobacteria bacterium]
MTSRNFAARDIVELLDRQIEALGHMLLGLEAEQKALESRDLDALNSAMDVKTGCMARLETTARELAAIPARHGEDVSLTERREHVRVLSDRCRELNDTNGLLITGQQRFVAGALGVLQIDARQPATYGPSGANPQTGQSRNRLASA